jgi:hypothetical protein
VLAAVGLVPVSDSRVSRRRLLLALAGLTLASGCASEADKINRLVFGAVKKDPLFLWHPAWVIKVKDMENPLGGFYPQGATTLSHDLHAESLAATALSDAINVALASGWQARRDGVGYVKAIANSTLRLWVTFSQTMESNVLTMIFGGLNA